MSAPRLASKRLVSKRLASKRFASRIRLEEITVASPSGQGLAGTDNVDYLPWRRPYSIFGGDPASTGPQLPGRLVLRRVAFGSSLKKPWRPASACPTASFHLRSLSYGGQVASLAMTWMVRPRTMLSSSAKAGDPVRCGLSVLSSTSLEYWITRMRG